MRLKQHPFLALCLVTLLLGVANGFGLGPSMVSLKGGFGETAASVGLVIVFGTMLGSILAESGATMSLAHKMLGNGSGYVELRMALLAGLIGLPMFFESGLALLIPLVVTLASLAGERGDGLNPYIRIGMPALATLSVLHGFTPPHPGPTVMAGLLHADVGRVLLLGVILAIPIAAIAGLALPRLVGRGITGKPSATLTNTLTTSAVPNPAGAGSALVVLLLPALLIAGHSAIVALGLPIGNLLEAFSDPAMALFATILVAIPLLSLRSGRKLGDIAEGFSASILSAAPIILVVAAGGGFKKLLVDSGTGTAIAHAAPYLALSPLVLGWCVAALIRVATGSATVAGITAAGIIAPLLAANHAIDPAMMVLSIGAGSLFFSHINDAAFWQVRGYFGLSLPETLKTWSVMETVISVLGLAGVMILTATGI